MADMVKFLYIYVIYDVIFGPEDAVIVFEGPEMEQHLHFSDLAEDFVFWHAVEGIPNESALDADTMSVLRSLLDVLKDGQVFRMR